MCPDKYAREEIIDTQFIQSLNQIKIDGDVVDWVVSVMKKSTCEQRKKQEAEAVALKLDLGGWYIGIKLQHTI